MATRREKNKEKWEESKAKARLRKDIIEGRINDTDTPKDVYNMHPELYHKWCYNNFSANFRRLRKAIARDHERMVQDCMDYGHDKAIIDAQPSGKLLWHRSAAAFLLKQDIENGKHKEMTPKQLRASRDEYQEFDLRVFRQHIYQENDHNEKKNWRLEKKKRRQKLPSVDNEEENANESVVMVGGTPPPEARHRGGGAWRG